jgi:hypothetical protein
VSSFRPIGRYEILVDTRPPLVIHVSPTCYRLRQAETLAFESRDSQICDYGGDALLVDDQRCSILAIVPYEDKTIRSQDEELDRAEEDQDSDR